ncbi:MAG: type II toxin-antitoxin system RelE/ParE family toxin [Candidatus Nanoarchaeia archaeon]|nr:type II toxin-antitoxin system RelE/ParE family toxin [Candidatus Nanoarchaeia archaeon]MDD5054521.1 type II toxin-antitoxin system RelE/ParE family toxin [Candidatus Nanoarchaeia archaeon]
MSYELIFDKKAAEFLESLDKETAKRIFNKIILSKEEPLKHFIRLSGRNDYKLRIGQYRVIADIGNNTKQIQITLIGLRKKIYKK